MDTKENLFRAATNIYIAAAISKPNSNWYCLTEDDRRKLMTQSIKDASKLLILTLEHVKEGID